MHTTLYHSILLILTNIFYSITIATYHFPPPHIFKIFPNIVEKSGNKFRNLDGRTQTQLMHGLRSYFS